MRTSKAAVAAGTLLAALSLTACSSAATSSTGGSSTEAPAGAPSPVYSAGATALASPPAQEARPSAPANKSVYEPADDTIDAKVGQLVLIPVASSGQGEVPEGFTQPESKILTALNPKLDVSKDPRAKSIVVPKKSIVTDATGYLLEATKPGSEDYTIKYKAYNGKNVSVTFHVTVTE